MQNYPFLQTLKQKWNIMFMITLLVIVTSFVVSVVQVPKYKSSVQILITQKYGFNTDIYAASKFTEYLSNLLNEVIYSKSFFDQVMNSGFGVVNDFSTVAEKRAKEWKKVVKTKVISNTGIISIDVYHKDRGQADRLANSIANILVTKSDQYHGAGAQVQVKIIDGPSTTTRTASPNLLINLAIGLILGLVLGGMFIYMFPTIYLDQWFGGESRGYIGRSNPVSPVTMATPTNDYGQGGLQIAEKNGYGQPSNYNQ